MNRTVVVTGSDGGIGGACLDAFAASGDTLIALDRRSGVELCDPGSVGERLNALAGIDVLVHAAGSVGHGGIEETSLREWRRVVDDNLTSAFVTTQAALPMMGEGASIVLLSSVNARTGGSRLSGPAYASSKAALLGLMRFLAADLAPRGIRANAVAPGPVETPMLTRLTPGELTELLRATPLRRFATPQEVAELVVFLASPAASSITGAVIDNNGGRWFA